MTFRHAIAGAAALSAVAGAGAGPAVAAQETQGAVPHQLQKSYESAYDRVDRLGGTPGRDIIDDGITEHGDHRAATGADVRHSLNTLRGMEASLTQPAATSSATVAGGSTTTSATSSSLPSCTWAPESGGDYNAVNPSSGARGKYQIMPETYAANGGDGSWSPADQERVAQNVMASQGTSAWANC